jgi:hypothetical protein
MKDKITINVRSDDHLRPILTDAFPMEIPFIVREEKVYRLMHRLHQFLHSKKTVAKGTGKARKFLRGVPLRHVPKEEWFDLPEFNSKTKDSDESWPRIWILIAGPVLGAYKLEKGKGKEKEDWLQAEIPAPSAPLVFKIPKGPTKTRDLALVHPRCYWGIAQFYKKYAWTICQYAARSAISLRRPVRISLSKRTVKSAEVDSAPQSKAEVDLVNQDFAKSYSSTFFAYKSFQRSYKFFESEMFAKLERRFQYLVTLDIAQCFGSIYTHSISWALHSKLSTKQSMAFYFNNPKRLPAFADNFDRLMQCMNWNETNGIVVGSELSRVFAELILQAVDASVLERLKVEHEANQFAIYRYVDDYYLFGNDTKLLERCVSLLENALGEYKLHLNPAKQQRIERPFITAKGVAIVQADTEMNSFWDALRRKPKKTDGAQSAGGTVSDKNSPKSTEDKATDHETGTDDAGSQQVSLEITPMKRVAIKKIRNKTKLLLRTVQKIRAICHGSGDGYHLVANYVVSAVSKRTEILFRENEGYWNSNATSALAVMIELMFHMHVVAPSSSNSNHITLCCIRAVNHLEKYHRPALPLVKRLIFDNIVRFLEMQSESLHGPGSVESLNMIIALSKLGTEFCVPDPQLLKWVNIDAKLEKLPYFSVVTILYYMRDRDEYADLKSQLVEAVIKRFNELQYEEIFNEAESTYLAMDVVACPFVAFADRTRLMSRLLQVLPSTLFRGSKSHTEDDAKEGVQVLEKGGFCVDWKSSELTRILNRKILTSVYTDDNLDR